MTSGYQRILGLMFIGSVFYWVLVLLIMFLSPLSLITWIFQIPNDVFSVSDYRKNIFLGGIIIYLILTIFGVLGYIKPNTQQ